ncbi:MAG: cupredoxin domain-containing protein [Nitrososphaeraceae archaeon]
MTTKHILLILPIVLALTIHISNTEIFAQTGSMGNVPKENPDYAVNIVPGASLKETPFHYYPPKIAIPIDTTVSWLNLDVGQPHTVTSGQPGSADKGVVFNSGVMPAFPVRGFEFTFSQPGEVLYHCIIHPWRVASVSVSDASFTGASFDIGLGSGATWDISSTPRVLMDISPKTVPLDKVTPITYNVTINDGGNNKTLLSELFTTGGESLPLELVSGMGNETSFYGPDFSTTGAYHVQSDFKKGTSYPISVEIVSIDGKPVEFPIKASFSLKTSS